MSEQHEFTEAPYTEVFNACADAYERIRELEAQRDDLLEACKIAIDALGCDRVRQDRLRAQELIQAAIRKAEEA